MHRSLSEIDDKIRLIAKLQADISKQAVGLTGHAKKQKLREAEVLGGSLDRLRRERNQALGRR